MDFYSICPLVEDVNVEPTCWQGGGASLPGINMQALILSMAMYTDLMRSTVDFHDCHVILF